MKKSNINNQVEECRKNERALLIDVRSPEEYAQGHIPGSVNIPMQDIVKITDYAADESVPLYVYCAEGIRSRQAVDLLKRAGFTEVHNIGGIDRWRGDWE